MPAVTCTRCSRPLTSAKSRAVRMGPTCLRKVEAAAKVVPLTGYRKPQIERAAKLLISGGVQREGTLFFTLSSDGIRGYRTDPTTQSCTCMAGQNGRKCFHQLAVAVLAAA